MRQQTSSNTNRLDVSVKAVEMEKASLPFACILQIRLSLSSVLPFFCHNLPLFFINPLTEISAGKLVRKIKVRYVNAYYIGMAEKVNH